MTHEFTHQELVYTVKGNTAREIDQRARHIAEEFFGVPVDLQVKVSLNPVASEKNEAFYKAEVVARERK
jgi:GTPase Era involved in 16S rRNA processing